MAVKYIPGIGDISGKTIPELKELLKKPMHPLAKNQLQEAIKERELEIQDLLADESDTRDIDAKRTAPVVDDDDMDMELSIDDKEYVDGEEVFVPGADEEEIFGETEEYYEGLADDQLEEIERIEAEKAEKAKRKAEKRAKQKAKEKEAQKRAQAERERLEAEQYEANLAQQNASNGDNTPVVESNVISSAGNIVDAYDDVRQQGSVEITPGVGSGASNYAPDTPVVPQSPTDVKHTQSPVSPTQGNAPIDYEDVTSTEYSRIHEKQRQEQHQQRVNENSLGSDVPVDAAIKKESPVEPTPIIPGSNENPVNNHPQAPVESTARTIRQDDVVGGSHIDTNSLHDEIDSADYSRTHQYEQRSDEGHPSRVISEQEKAYYHFGEQGAIPKSVAGQFASKDAVSADIGNKGQSVSANWTQVDAAKAVLASYNNETSIINHKIIDLNKTLSDHENRLVQGKGKLSEAELTKLNDSINSVKTEINKHQTRLTEIKTDTVRVNDFINNGPVRASAKSQDIIKSHVNKDDILGSDFSRKHRIERGDIIGNDKLANKILPPIPGADGKGNFLTSAADMKQVHKARVAITMGHLGGAVWGGSVNLTKRIAAEDEDLDKTERAYDKTKEVIRVRGQFAAHVKMKHELDKLGLGTKALSQELKNIGVVPGVGDVSKMSLKELNEALKGNISQANKEKIIRAIEIKNKIKAGPMKLADEALKKAGEYANFSKRRLEKLLKNPALDVVTKRKIQAALEYHKLSKYHRLAGGRWRATGRLFGGALKSIMDKEETFSAFFGLANNARTVYQVSKVSYKVAVKGAKTAVNATKGTAKLVKNTYTGVKNLGTTLAQARTKAQGADVGRRIGTLVGKTNKTVVVAKGSSKFAQSKVGQAMLRAAERAKAAAAAVGKAIAGAAKAVVGAIAGAVGGGGLIAIIAVVLSCLMIFLPIALIFGDDGNGTSVPEMVEYLHEKNADWLEEIQSKADSRPSTKDKNNEAMSEYTKVTYTYLDENGNVCMVTDNTKHLISMAAVYFEQDFSDADKVYDYLDKMWDASHSVTYTESPLYGCDGTVCLKEDGSFNTDAVGYNGATQKYDCREDVNKLEMETGSMYPNAFSIPGEKQKRIDKMWDSARFNSVDVNKTKYAGIYPYTEDSYLGYGCVTHPEELKCDKITTYNGEQKIALVDTTGWSYETLVDKGGCSIKHSGLGEGEPMSQCTNSTYTYYYARLSGMEGFDKSKTYNFVWDESQGYYIYTDANGVKYRLSGNGQGRNGKYNNTDTLSVYYRSGSSYNCFVFRVKYYSCADYGCSGHNIATHYCKAEHEEKVCQGHCDLKINICVLGYDDLFKLEVTNLPYYDNGEHGGLVDTSNLCTHSNQTVHSSDAAGNPTSWTCNTCGVNWTSGVGYVCTHSNQTVNETDANGDTAKWTCNGCGVIWIAGVGYDYSNVGEGYHRAEEEGGVLNMNVWLESDIEWCKGLFEQDWYDLYGVTVSSSLYVGQDGVGTIIMPTHPNSLPIPLFNQLDYPTSPYGEHGTVSSHGCGITCVAMLNSYYADQTISPAFLARMFGHYNTPDGSYHSLFEESSGQLNLPFDKETTSWAEVVKALQDGKPVVSIQNEGIFTKGGHFILLTGITSNGRILVNDPNGANYTKDAVMVAGFADGFTQSQIQANGGKYWIYGVKPVAAPESQ